jgi:hypothetical protein
MGFIFQYQALRGSEALGANEGVGEIDGEEEAHGAAQDVVEQHGTGSSLKTVAGFGVGKAQAEEDDDDAEHGDIHRAYPSGRFRRQRSVKALVWRGTPVLRL